jgi:DNA primase
VADEVYHVDEVRSNDSVESARLIWRFTVGVWQATVSLMLADGRKLVLDATDIVQLVSRSVGLKKSGRSFIGLCPFHNERTPSFHVYPDTQSFHCFGCKKSGNAIDFVIERDKLDFKGALELLAREAGIELPRFSGDGQKAGERQRLLDVQAAGVKFFRRMLLERGKAAREYLAKRGFNDSILDEFKVGFAPDEWDAVLGSNEFKPFEPPLLVQAGLLKARESGDGFYDTFRGRVMFPIRDESGKTIAFGGRVLPGSDNPAKYLNSPETPLFSKSRTVFGLDLARSRIVETRTVVIVEGYTDVVMAHQFDVRNVVSILGTALTEPHMNLLKRFADRVVLLFDADAAGDTAAERAMENYLSAPLEIGIASMPEGLDPDEVLLQSGKAGFEKIIGSATDAVDFFWRRMWAKYKGESSDMARERAIGEFIERVVAMRSNPRVDRLRLDGLLVKLAHRTQIPLDTILRQRAELARKARFQRTGGKTTARPQMRGGGRSSSSPATSPGGGADAGMPMGYSSDGSNEVRFDVSEAGEVSSDFGRVSSGSGWLSKGPVVARARERAEKMILGAILIEPSRWIDVQERVTVEDFADARLRVLAGRLWDLARNEGPLPLGDVLAWLDGEPNSGELKSLAAESAHETQQRIDQQAGDQTKPRSGQSVQQSSSGTDAKKASKKSVGPKLADPQEPGPLDRILADCLNYLTEERHRDEMRRLLARRPVDSSSGSSGAGHSGGAASGSSPHESSVNPSDPPGEGTPPTSTSNANAGEDDWLRSIQEQAKRADMRRSIG